MEVLAPKIELWCPLPQSISLEKHEASWLAALIDGEGTISIYRSARKENKSGWKYRPVVEINNTSMALMQKIASLVPGWLTIHNKARNQKHGHKILYRFMTSTRHMVDLIDEVSPFLIVKHNQSKVVRRMCELMHKGNSRDSGLHHELYDGFYLQCKALNQRGLGV